MRDRSVLLHDGQREIVFGSVGRIHRLFSPELVPMRTVPEFTRFHAPGHEKVAVSMRMLGDNPRAGVALIVEYRVLALDSEALRWFSRRFHLLRPIGSFLCRQVLRAVKSRAEEDYRRPAPRFRTAPSSG
jgi:hypothetical protein